MMMRVFGGLVLLALAGVAHCQLLGTEEHSECDPTDLTCAPLEPGEIRYINPMWVQIDGTGNYTAGAERVIRNCDGDEECAAVEKNIPDPEEHGRRIDWCGKVWWRDWDRSTCGQEAAQYWCENYKSIDKTATNWKKNDGCDGEDTIRLMDMSECDQTWYRECDCFEYIQCKQT